MATKPKPVTDTKTEPPKTTVKAAPKAKSKRKGYNQQTGEFVA